MARRIESLFVAGPAGRLEAVLEEPAEGAVREAALVCHPHPLHGGTLHNKVVHRLAPPTLGRARVSPGTNAGMIRLGLVGMWWPASMLWAMRTAWRACFTTGLR